MCHRPALALLYLLFAASALPSFAAPARDPLDPRGKIHIPIGIPDTVDTLKTFVEAEGNFSPGCGSYGIYFWVYDPETKTLTAPTQDGVACEHGLTPEGYLIPWSRWSAGGLTVTTSVCEVRRASPAGDVFVVGAKASLANAGTTEKRIALIVALRPLGPAGFTVNSLTVDSRSALLVDGRPALVCDEPPMSAGVAADDCVGRLAAVREIPAGTSAQSADGNCSGAMLYLLTIAPGTTLERGFVCPVLPGRRAVGHRWDGESPWAQFDLNAPNPAEGGILQPDPGLAYYRALKAETLFAESAAFWKDFTGRVAISLPDPRWTQALAAILGHAAMAMNEGAPDVTVVNYNVFSRDGVYVANILQKSGRLDLAEKAIDYFLAHPFNGRVQVEADNPGQVLWAMGEHWRLGRDKTWLGRVYPAVAKLAAMIRYYRIAPPPHWVRATSLEFGDALPPDAPDAKPAHKRQILKPGACDGFNPNYTEAFDVAGLRAAAALAKAAGKPDDARAWTELARMLMEVYDERFGAKLPSGYGSYSVLWPCRLYPLEQGRGFDAFQGIGAQKPTRWRYFPLATAHQGLLAGSRDAAWKTLDIHLDHEQMRGWYAFDEGGKSGAGGWKHLRTTWNGDVAMPHGWAIAEAWLLLRDALAFEDGDRLVLLPGVPPDWFRKDMAIGNMPTYFGPLGLTYKASGDGATLTLTGQAAPPGGFVLRLPRAMQARVTADGKDIPVSETGDAALPAGTKEARIAFEN
jgi:hypothetical protein